MAEDIRKVGEIIDLSFLTSSDFRTLKENVAAAILANKKYLSVTIGGKGAQMDRDISIATLARSVAFEERRRDGSRQPRTLPSFR